jgi:protein-disulfide isomerase
VKQLFASLLLVLGFAAAQISAPPAQLLTALEGLNPTETAQGYRAGSVQFALENRGEALYCVSGEAILDQGGRQALAQLVGAVTGYGAGIAEPLAEFLDSRTTELAGRGEIPLTVEEFVLTLSVTGDAAPYNARFGLELLSVPAEAFPPSRHTLGPQDAEIIIREFSDFQCPYCAQYATGILPELKETLLARGDVRFEYHHLPLTSIHANAQLAAEAAECVTAANTPAAFWIYHDALFARQQAWAQLGDAQSYFVRLARELGLSNSGVAVCLNQERYTREVQEAFRVATQELGLNSTPSVFVGGYRVPTAAAGTLAGYEQAIARLEAFAE